MGNYFLDIQYILSVRLKQYQKLKIDFCQMKYKKIKAKEHAAVLWVQEVVEFYIVTFNLKWVTTLLGQTVGATRMGQTSNGNNVAKIKKNRIKTDFHGNTDCPIFIFYNHYIEMNWTLLNCMSKSSCTILYGDLQYKNG